MLFTALLSISVHAAHFDSAEIPNAPGTLRIKPLLEAVSSGNTEKIGSFVKDNFHPDFLDAHPMETHVNYLLNIHDEEGTLTYHSLRTYDEPLPKNQFVVIFRSERTENWRAFTIDFSDERDQKVTNLEFSQANRPSNIPEPEPLTLNEALDELDGFVKRMASNGVFSGTLLLAKGETILYQAAHGEASKRFKVPNNLQTKFNLGSMNKMFTSTAIMQLVSQGKLSLTDTLSDFADESWLAKDITRKIEIQHLLTHSSGLGSYFNQTYMSTSKSLYRTLDDYKPLIKNETLRFEPGSDNAYSNTGMFMLGVVIEKASGQDYFSYIREHIFEPAGMTNSDSYEMDQPVPNLAIGYEKDRNTETGWRNNLYAHVLKGGPAGGGFSTVQDLHRFALALAEFRLLDEKHTKMLYTAKPKLHAPLYGFGFNVAGTSEDRIVGHGGGFDGISANLDIYLDRGYVSAVLSNHGSGSRTIEAKIMELLSRVPETM
jgi:CubicO group peptidase (beta-lactamase class C family)